MGNSPHKFKILSFCRQTTATGHQIAMIRGCGQSILGRGQNFCARILSWPPFPDILHLSLGKTLLLPPPSHSPVHPPWYDLYLALENALIWDRVKYVKQPPPQTSQGLGCCSISACRSTSPTHGRGSRLRADMHMHNSLSSRWADPNCDHSPVPAAFSP